MVEVPTFGSSGYYPASQTAEYTEDYQAGEKGADYLQQLCIDWEKAAELPADSPIRHVSVRIGNAVSRLNPNRAQSFPSGHENFYLGVVLGRRGGVIQSLIVPFWLGELLS